MNERTIGYIEGIFDILTLLNEDNYGREFYLTEIELKDKIIENKLKDLFGNEYKFVLNPINDFKIQIEYIYNNYCQNFMYKIGRLKSQNPTTNEIEEISKRLNNSFIQELFVNSLNSFAQNCSKVIEVKIEENYNHGLPNKGYLIYKEQKCYFLHFAITG